MRHRAATILTIAALGAGALTGCSSHKSVLGLAGNSSPATTSSQSSGGAPTSSDVPTALPPDPTDAGSSDPGSTDGADTAGPAAGDTPTGDAPVDPTTDGNAVGDVAPPVGSPAAKNAELVTFTSAALPLTYHLPSAFREPTGPDRDTVLDAEDPQSGTFILSIKERVPMPRSSDAVRPLFDKTTTIKRITVVRFGTVGRAWRVESVRSQNGSQAVTYDFIYDVNGMAGHLTVFAMPEHAKSTSALADIIQLSAAEAPSKRAPKPKTPAKPKAKAPAKK